MLIQEWISAIHNECVYLLLLSLSLCVACTLSCWRSIQNNVKQSHKRLATQRSPALLLSDSMSRSLSSVWSFVPAHTCRINKYRKSYMSAWSSLTDNNDSWCVHVCLWPLVHFTWQVSPLFSSDGDGSTIRFSGIVEVSSTWKYTSVCWQILGKADASLS